MRFERVWIGVILMMVAAAAKSGGLALAASIQQQSDSGLAKIAAPQTDAVVSGNVQILGTAIDPVFLQYELDFAVDPPVGADAWKPIQPPIAQQIQDGVLGAWETTSVPDGIYWIRLQVARQDGTNLEDRVRVQVANATPTPTPTEAPPPTLPPPPNTPTPGPSPTSVIWQPPTRTPRPTLTPGGPTRTPNPLAADDTPFRADRLQAAARTGVLIALGVYVMWAGYGLLRAALRRELRGQWRQFRAEFLNPLIAALRRRRK